MDETTRRLEREAAEGNPRAVLRLANQHLHAGERELALSTTAEVADPAVLAFRARLFLDAGDLCAAGEAAGDAHRLSPGSLPDDLAEDLGARLTTELRSGGVDDDPLWVLRMAGLLAGIGRLEASPELKALEEAWPEASPLIEALRARDPRRSARGTLARAVARGAIGAAAYPEEPVPTRLFSAHGPDFKSGTFLTFESSCEDRLTYFDAALFHAVERLLPPADEGYERALAFGRGYGLAVERGAPTALLEEAVERINDLRLLPFTLVVHHHQPFDVLLGVDDAEPNVLGAEDQRLARRFAEDLSRHPARMGNPNDTAPYARLLGSFRGGNPEPAELDALLAACEASYGPVGHAALARFARRAHSENERMAARRAARRSS